MTLATTYARFTPEQWALAGATALSAIGSFITVLRSSKQGRRNGERIDDVHEQVQDAQAEQAHRIDQLTTTVQRNNNH